MSLLTNLNQWKVAPPPPNEYDNSGGGGNNREWDYAIFRQLEDLRWKIEEKGWKDNIHIGQDVVSMLPNIPESYIRSLMDALMAYPAKGFKKYIIKGS